MSARQHIFGGVDVEEGIAVVVVIVEGTDADVVVIVEGTDVDVDVVPVSHPV